LTSLLGLTGGRLGLSLRGTGFGSGCHRRLFNGRKGCLPQPFLTGHARRVIFSDKHLGALDDDLRHAHFPDPLGGDDIHQIARQKQVGSAFGEGLIQDEAAQPHRDAELSALLW
jgi:hypothetical protein